MNIFNLLSQNLGQGSRTRPPDEAVPYPAGYRGQINHEAALCTACGTCIYTCSPGAITRDNSVPEYVVWQYSEDRCTFCGFCVEYCPTQALSFVPSAPAIVADRSQHVICHRIDCQPCPGCGRLIRPLSEATLIGLYGDPLPEDVAASRMLCESCRQRATTRRFREALAGK